MPPGREPYYRSDLALVHHLGFGSHADACAPGILVLLEGVRQRGARPGSACPTTAGRTVPGAATTSATRTSSSARRWFRNFSSGAGSTWPWERRSGRRRCPSGCGP